MSERPKEADCKSAGLRLRRFESFSRHGARIGNDTECPYNQAPLAQTVERFHGKEEVFGSIPEGGSAADEVSRWRLALANLLLARSQKSAYADLLLVLRQVQNSVVTAGESADCCEAARR